MYVRVHMCDVLNADRTGLNECMHLCVCVCVCVCTCTYVTVMKGVGVFLCNFFFCR